MNSKNIQVDSLVYDISKAPLGGYVVDQVFGTVQVIHDDEMATVTWEDGKVTCLPLKNLNKVR